MLPMFKMAGFSAVCVSAEFFGAELATHVIAGLYVNLAILGGHHPTF
jgi:hypothetical protein